MKVKQAIQALSKLNPELPLYVMDWRKNLNRYECSGENNPAGIYSEFEIGEERVGDDEGNPEDIAAITIENDDYTDSGDFDRSIGHLQKALVDDKLEVMVPELIKIFGREAQINKIQEECLELALILNQRNCPTKDPRRIEHALYGELADVYIMMAQAIEIFDKERIFARAMVKLNRACALYFPAEEKAEES